MAFQSTLKCLKKILRQYFIYYTALDKQLTSSLILISDKLHLLTSGFLSERNPF